MHLPLEGAFNSARRGGQKYRGWDGQSYAAADIANSMRSLVFLFTAANRDPKKSKMPKPPKPFPTPDTEGTEAPKKPNMFRQMVAHSKNLAKKAGK
jgi:hypothetical protein